MEEIDLKEENLKLRRDITNLEQQVLESHAERIKTLKINQELTNEMVLIKGITITNSPELREANKKIKKLEETLERLTNPVQKARESGL
jgi:predicted unusual protein kinase regulating ubiquinone biosynthesis (AarF/ABC1/UbiB family)|tara:strand:+ start:199 stop:465 length:267 start_codon:yes stop_codon:yes gene_type:complete